MSRGSAGSVKVAVGDVLADKYRVERVLGVGGMGAVVAARHLELDELRAVKLMLPELSENAQAVARFLREARAVARLTNPHVAKVHDLGRLPDGAPYIVMELLHGSDLATRLESSGRLDPSEAADLIMQVLEVLAEAHAAGIVHRDLKPANLFVTKDTDGAACVKVLDFGIAKLTDAAAAMAVTGTSAVIGSPFYMSPEQMRSSREVDHRSDIWSIGVLLYELTTGTLPFKGETVAHQGALVLGTLPDAPSTRRADLPPAFDALVLRCLGREPEARFEDVRALAQALAPLTSDGAKRSLDRIERALGQMARTLPADSGPSNPAVARASSAHTGGAVSATLSGAARRSRSPWLAAVGVAAIVAALFALFGRAEKSPGAAADTPTPIVSAPVLAGTAPAPSAPSVADAPVVDAASQAASPVASTAAGTPRRPAVVPTRSASPAPAAPSGDPFGWSSK